MGGVEWGGMERSGLRLYGTGAGGNEARSVSRPKQPPNKKKVGGIREAKDMFGDVEKHM